MVGVEQSEHLSLNDQTSIVERRPNLVTKLPICLRVRAAVVVETDVEPGEVADVSGSHISDERLFGTSFLPSTNHDCRAVRVVRANENATVTSQLLKADPNVRLDVFDQMADVNVPVRVRQRGSHKDSTLCHCGSQPGI